MKFKSFLLLTVFCFSWKVFSKDTLVTPKWSSKKQPFSIQIQTEYFNTTSNYKLLGEYQNLTKENFLTYVSNNLSADYSFFPWLNVEAFFNTMWASSFTDNTLRNKFGITHSGLGFSLLHRFSYFQVGLGFKGGAPLHQIYPQTNEIVLGDGAYFANYHLTFAYEHPSKLFHIFYNTNFLYRSFGLSSILFNNIGLNFNTSVINAGLAAQFFMSALSQDTYTHSPNTRWGITDRVNGGSYKFYSVNPGALSFTGWMEWKLRSINFKVYTNIDTYGQNYAKGMTLGIVTRLKWNTKKRAKSYSEQIMKNRKINSKSKRYLKEDDDENSVPINKELMEELKQLR